MIRYLEFTMTKFPHKILQKQLLYWYENLNGFGCLRRSYIIEVDVLVQACYQVIFPLEKRKNKHT